MPTRDVGERRRVDDAQIGDAVHAQVRVEHAAVCARRHARGAARVVKGLRALAHYLRQAYVVLLVQEVVEFRVDLVRRQVCSASRESLVNV